MIEIVIDCDPQIVNTESIRPNWNRANMTQIREDLSNSHWRETLWNKTVEEQWSIFRETISESINKNVPSSGVRTRLKNPWMTREILRLCRKKRHKWKIVKNSVSAEERSEYKQLEKEVAKNIRNAKRRM